MSLFPDYVAYHDFTVFKNSAEIIYNQLRNLIKEKISINEFTKIINNIQKRCEDLQNQIRKKDNEIMSLKHKYENLEKKFKFLEKYLGIHLENQDSKVYVKNNDTPKE